LAAGDEGISEPAEALGDFDADPARVFAGAAPLVGVGLEGMVALQKIVGGLHQDRAQAAIGAAAQGAA
jgi:hypothetical protein